MKLPTVEPEHATDGETRGTGDDGSEPTTPTVHRAVITIGGQAAEPEEDEDDALKPLPDRLVMELTAHRTLALRDALANNPHVAMTVLLHKLVVDTFQRTSSIGGCLEATVRHVFFNVQPADLKDSPSAKSVADRYEAWKTDIPQDDQTLWDWLTALDDASRVALLAHCVSYGVNALYEKADRYGGPGISQHELNRRLGQADRLAQAVGLDMVEAGWRPTVDNYLGRVPKRRILEAVREGAGERAAQLIDHLKKGDMAKEAERLLADTGWLPEPLRHHDSDHPAQVGGEDGEAETLPEFLAGDDEETAVEDAEEPHPQVIAAE